MSDVEDRKELAELARDVAAYARYAREIGDGYVSAGPTAPSVRVSGTSASRAAVQEEQEEREPMPVKKVSELVRTSGAAGESLEDIRADLGDCTRCKLHPGRTNIVYGEGNPNASLMFAGEGPGADEDASGRPFVGAAGQLLDRIIESIGWRREAVYTAHVVQCRPP